jgi:threonine synthase
MGQEILYYSTNQHIATQPEANDFSFGKALLKGMAQDEGLFMPHQIPSLDLDVLLTFKGKPYFEVANYIFSLFLKDEVPADTLKQITEEAYSSKAGWGESLQIPIEKLEDNLHSKTLQDNGWRG